MIRRFFEPPKHDRWDDYFEPGEVLLWQGAPEPGPHSYIGTIAISAFGIPFFIAGLTTAGMGLGRLFAVSGVSDFGTGLFLTAFSVPFLGVGTAMTFGTWLYAANSHKFTRYALSNKRAYLATSLFRHSIATYTIAADDPVTLVQGRTDSVRFKSISARDSDGDVTFQKVGFENIKDGPEVYALIRQIQREQQ